MKIRKGAVFITFVCLLATALIAPTAKAYSTAYPNGAIKAMSLGAHSAVVKNGGSLWLWGINCTFRLGSWRYDDHRIPFKLMDNVKTVALGGEHSAAIKTDGSLWMWGPILPPPGVYIIAGHKRCILEGASSRPRVGIS